MRLAHTEKNCKEEIWNKYSDQCHCVVRIEEEESQWRVLEDHDGRSKTVSSMYIELLGEGEMAEEE